MATTNLSTKYQPLRVGFLVREGNIDDLVNAAEMNTLLWGGIFNPVIPVSNENSSFVRKLITLFRVDTFYSISNTEAIQKVVNDYSYLKDPHYVAEKFFVEDLHSRKKNIAYLDTLNIIQYFWEEEIKFKSKKFKSNCLLIEWSSEDPLRNLFSIVFGKYPEFDELNDNFKKAFINGLRAKRIEITPNEQIDQITSSHVYPLLLTSKKLLGYNPPFHRYGLYVGDENNFYDLMYFWNLRASGIKLNFLSVNHLDRLEPFIKQYLNELDKIPNQNPSFEDDISIHYSSLDFEKEKEILERYKTKKRFLFSYCDEISWNGLNVKPATYCFETENVLANIDKSYNRYRITFKLPPKDFIKELRSRASQQIFKISINPITEFEYPDHVLKVPYIFELNEFYSRSIKLDPWKLRVEKEGIGIIIRGFESSVTLFPIPNHDLIHQILHFSGIKSELSQAGLITKRIIEKLGHLDAGRVFKIRGVRNLFQKLRSDECIQRGEAKRILWGDEQFKKYEELYIEPRDRRKLSTDDVFDFLLKNEFFRAGLQFICENCNLKSWLSLREIDDIWICEYCGFQNQSSLHLKSRGDWMFRKSGLFAKDNNQEGAIPVITTLIQFLRIFHGINFIYTTSINIEMDSKRCEIDFCILQYALSNIEEKFEIGIGECKSEGGKIVQDDIENLLLIREKLRSIHNLKCYLIFSKTSDGFSSDEINLFNNLLSERVPLILLTNSELEPYEPYWDKENIPVKYVHTMEDMVRNSHYLYLRQGVDNSTKT